MSGSLMTIAGKISQQPIARRVSLFLPFALYVVGALVFFRQQIFSGFDLSFGDRGDNRLIIFIHEHVYRSLHADSLLLSPPFFFNQPNTLGYTDALLLDQAIYVPLRLLGADPLVALSLTILVLSALAFSCVYLLLRRLDVSIPLASFAALIFTFSNNLFLKSYHPQLFTVYYIPILAFCGLLAVTELHRRPARAYLTAAFAGVLYGLLFSSGYYMAWFFGLALLFFVPFAGVFARHQARAWWQECPRCVLGLVLVASASFLAALSIFAMIYGPVLALGAGRSFAEYLALAPHPVDIVNVGLDNALWSRLIRSLHLISDERLDDGEVRIALTPIVIILLLSSAAFAFRTGFWPADDSGRIRRAVVIAGAGVCLLFFALTIKLHNFSLFHILYAIVPGASAIRAGYRGMLVANLGAVIAIGLTFDRIIHLSLREPRRGMRLGRLTAVVVALFLAALEQVNLAKEAELSRRFEREYFSTLGPIPHECQAFYIARQANRPAPYVQIDAMMIALDRHLPTINGHSGVLPPGWDFYDTDATDYEQRAERWALKRGIAEGLCRADVDQGTWTAVARDRDWICAPDGCVHRMSFDQSREFEIDLARGGNGASFTDAHWSEPESNGRWTNATHAALSFSIDAPRDLDVAISMRPLLSNSAPKLSASVEANRCRVAAIQFDLADNPSRQTISGTIPSRCINADGKVVLHVNTDRAQSPQEIGINNDPRRFGIWVERVTIRQSER
jgi:hypothetical protein